MPKKNSVTLIQRETGISRKEASLLVQYGLSLEHYNALRKRQDYKCKICGAAENLVEKNGCLHVDHCHKTLKIRGLLCKHCNVGLGFFKDNVSNLQKAILYLKISQRSEKVLDKLENL